MSDQTLSPEEERRQRCLQGYLARAKQGQDHGESSNEAVEAGRAAPEPSESIPSVAVPEPSEGVLAVAVPQPQQATPIQDNSYSINFNFNLTHPAALSQMRGVLASFFGGGSMQQLNWAKEGVLSNTEASTSSAISEEPKASTSRMTYEEPKASTSRMISEKPKASTTRTTSGEPKASSSRMASPSEPKASTSRATSDEPQAQASTSWATFDESEGFNAEDEPSLRSHADAVIDLTDFEYDLALPEDPKFELRDDSYSENDDDPDPDFVPPASQKSSLSLPQRTPAPKRTAPTGVQAQLRNFLTASAPAPRNRPPGTFGAPRLMEPAAEGPADENREERMRKAAAEAAEDLGRCSVCYVNIVNSKLRCGHAFCCQCLQTLKAQRKGCPKCRKAFRKWEPVYLG